jgi:hypothetical protein
MATDRKYELRGWELYLDGERLPVSPVVVRALIERRARNSGDVPCRDHRGWAPLDADSVNRILRLERIMAISRLATLLKEKAA